MSEYDNFVYEWTYDEDQGLYLCEGQTMLLGVFHDEEDNCWWGVTWDIEPSDPRWGDASVEVLMQQHHADVHTAMDWCETLDTHEASFDSPFNF